MRHLLGLLLIVSLASSNFVYADQQASGEWANRTPAPWNRTAAPVNTRPARQLKWRSPDSPGVRPQKQPSGAWSGRGKATQLRPEQTPAATDSTNSEESSPVDSSQAPRETQPVEADQLAGRNGSTLRKIDFVTLQPVDTRPLNLFDGAPAVQTAASSIDPFADPFQDKVEQTSHFDVTAPTEPPLDRPVIGRAFMPSGNGGPPIVVRPRLESNLAPAATSLSDLSSDAPADRAPEFQLSPPANLIDSHDAETRQAALLLSSAEEIPAESTIPSPPPASLLAQTDESATEDGLDFSDLFRTPGEKAPDAVKSDSDAQDAVITPAPGATDPADVPPAEDISFSGDDAAADGAPAVERPQPLDSLLPDPAGDAVAEAGEDATDLLPDPKTGGADESRGLSLDDLGLPNEAPNDAGVDDKGNDATTDPFKSQLDGSNLNGMGIEDDGGDFGALPGDDLGDDQFGAGNEQDAFDSRESTEPPCDRIYNERDCCAAENSCVESLDYLRRTTIDKISLDISPAFDPGEKDEAERAKAKAERLAKAPSRKWKDRRGNVVATGRLEDMREGDVHVRRQDGTTTSVRYLDLSRDDLCFVDSYWGLPSECTLDNQPASIRNWTLTTYTWKASGLCHKPLYFEDVQLERYGHSAGPVLQPLASGAHFFAQVALLPYNIGLHAPNECLYSLGYYRPGNCAPWLIPAFPLSGRAAANETLAILGLWGILH